MFPTGQPYRLLLSLSLCLFTYQGAREVISVLLPAIQTEFRLSFTALGVIAGSYNMGYSLSLLWGGMVADRYGKVRMIQWGLILFSLLTLLLVISTGAKQIAALRFASAFGFSTYFGAANALIAEAFDPTNTGKAVGFHYSGGAAGRLILPFLSGLIAAHFGWRYAFLALALSGLASWLAFTLITRRHRQLGQEKAKPSLKEFVDQVVRNRDLIRLSLIYFVVILSSTVTVLVPVYLVRTWGISLVAAASYLLITFIVSIASSPILGALADRWGWRPVSVGAMALNTLLLYLFPLTRPGILLIVVLGGLGMSTRVISVLISQATTLSPPRLRASALGLFNTAGTIGSTLVPIIGGYLADLFSLFTSFLFFALVSLVGMLVIAGTSLSPQKPRP